MTDERSILDDLERQSTGSYGANGSEMLNMEQNMDLSGVRESMNWAEGKYPFRIMEVEYKISKERIDEKTNKPVGNQPYLELNLFCFAGPCAGDNLDDRVMLAGKALSRFLNLVRAVGLYDEVNKCFKGRYADLIGLEVWGTVVNRDEMYKGEKRTKSGIAFTGYEPITKYEVPQDDDPFAEAGIVQATPVAVAPAAVSPKASESTRPAPFVDDDLEEVTEALDTLHATVMDEEAPADVRVAAAEKELEIVSQVVDAAGSTRPTTRPAARAAGDRPPF